MNPRRRAPIGWIVPLFVSSLAASAPSGAPAESRGFGETASVVAVEVPVTVVQGDQPVRGLSAADFELYDGNQRQKITGFEVVDLAAPAAPATSVAAAGSAAGVAPAPSVSGRRHFLLLFDLSFSEPAALIKAQEAAKGLLRNRLHPSDLVAVASYSTADGPKLLLGFTPDRRQAEYAVATLGAPQLVDRHPDPLGLIYLTDRAESGGLNPTGQESQDGFKSTAAAYFREVARVEVRAERQARKNSVVTMSRALAELAKLMARIDGKKYVVYLSEGFDSEFMLGTSDEETIKNNQAAAASGERDKIDSEQRYGDTKLTADVRRMLEEFRRADCTIESVDIGGVRAGADQDARHAGGKESLFTMARETGGDLVENTNDLGEGMAKLLARTSVTYILTFQPEGLALDGQYHALRVKLRKDRGARVVARPGYFAPSPFSQRSAAERRLAAASLVLGGGNAAGNPLHTAVLAAPFPGESGKPYVPVLIEIDGPALLEGAGDVAHTEIYAYALDEQGTIRDHFGQVLGLDVAKLGAALERGGARFYGHLDLDPGRYVVRVLVRNGVTGEASATAVPLTVPAFDGKAAALLPPLVPDASGSFVVLREGGGREKLRQVAFPFVHAERTFFPAARPRVAAGGATPLYLFASGLGAGSLTLSSRIFAADGSERPRSGAGAAGAGLAPPARAGALGGLDHLTSSFKPGNLPAGDYTLVVTLTDPATRRELSSSIPFEVVATAPGGTSR